MRSSVSVVYSVQLAFLKLMNVRLGPWVDGTSIVDVTRIGRWSDERVVTVDQPKSSARWALTKVRSGEEDAPLRGNLVGES